MQVCDERKTLHLRAKSISNDATVVVCTRYAGLHYTVPSIPSVDSSVTFTARCYADLDCYGKSSVCLSVRLSVTLKYRVHIGWNTSKINSSLINLDLDRPSTGIR